METNSITKAHAKPCNTFQYMNNLELFLSFVLTRGVHVQVKEQFRAMDLIKSRNHANVCLLLDALGREEYKRENGINDEEGQEENDEFLILIIF
uniref:Non-specific serine/threonine protein kinase n=1 Tax=Meloidogyne javanica TaxID=6303 RepID=A0A915LNK9_MELJA